MDEGGPESASGDGGLRTSAAAGGTCEAGSRRTSTNLTRSEDQRRTSGDARSGRERGEARSRLRQHRRVWAARQGRASLAAGRRDPPGRVRSRFQRESGSFAISSKSGLRILQAARVEVRGRDLVCAVVRGAPRARTAAAAREYRACRPAAVREDEVLRLAPCARLRRRPADTSDVGVERRRGAPKRVVAAVHVRGVVTSPRSVSIAGVGCSRGGLARIVHASPRAPRSPAPFPE